MFHKFHHFPYFYIEIQLMNNMHGLSQSDKIKSEKEIKILTQLGLSKSEAQVYHVLLVSKESTVGKISRSINFLSPRHQANYGSCAT